MIDELIQPFDIHVADEVLADPNDRLRRIRWTDETDAAAWRYGPPIAFMRRVADHWQNR